MAKQGQTCPCCTGDVPSAEMGDICPSCGWEMGFAHDDQTVWSGAAFYGPNHSDIGHYRLMVWQWLVDRVKKIDQVPAWCLVRQTEGQLDRLEERLCQVIQAQPARPSIDGLGENVPLRQIDRALGLSFERSGYEPGRRAIQVQPVDLVRSEEDFQELVDGAARAMPHAEFGEAEQELLDRYTEPGRLPDRLVWRFELLRQFVGHWVASSWYGQRLERAAEDAGQRVAAIEAALVEDQPWPHAHAVACQALDGLQALLDSWRALAE